MHPPQKLGKLLGWIFFRRGIELKKNPLASCEGIDYWISLLLGRIP